MQNKQTIEEISVELLKQPFLKSKVRSVFGKKRFEASILNFISEMIIIQDLDGRILFSNRPLANKTGYSCDEMEGKHCYAILRGLTQRCPDCPVQKSIHAGKIIEDTWTSPLDGTFYHVKCIPVRNKTGQIVHVVKILREQTFATNSVELSPGDTKNIIESLPDLILVINSKGVFKSAHANKKDQLLLPPIDIIGKHVSDILSPELAQMTIFFISKVLETGQLQTYCYRMNPSRNDRFFEARMLPNGPDHVVAIIRDITDQKNKQPEYNDQENKFHELADILPQTVFETDFSGYVTYTNNHGHVALGYSKNEIENGLNVFDLIIPEYINTAREKISQVLAGKDVSPQEFILRKKDGSLFPVLVYIKSILKNHRPVGVRGILADISRQKQTEKELIRSKEKAEESDRLKSSFLANMSHEIRTPLNGILGLAELLKDEDILIDDKREYINIINERGNYLLSIINDMIDVSKLEAGQLDLLPEEIYLSDFLKDFCNSIESEIIQKGKSSIRLIRNFSITVNTPIKTDKLRLRQILYNLVSNSIKYTLAGYIEIACRMLDDETIEFSVSDTGIGISTDKHTLIFERFRQADDGYTRKFGGTGLGLAISKQLVELMGGRISLESTPNEGSRFSFTSAKNISIGEKNNIQDMEKANKIHNWEGQTILIVEDDYSSFRFLEAVLKRTKATILHAVDGEDAIEICKTHPAIDLVLMDIQLPKVDGYTVTKKIKEFRKNLPVVAQTAHALEEDRTKSLKAGCDDYISKPINKNELLIILDKYLS